MATGSRGCDSPHILYFLCSLFCCPFSVAHAMTPSLTLLLSSWRGARLLHFWCFCRCIVSGGLRVRTCPSQARGLLFVVDMCMFPAPSAIHALSSDAPYVVSWVGFLLIFHCMPGMTIGGSWVEVEVCLSSLIRWGSRRRIFLGWEVDVGPKTSWMLPRRKSQTPRLRVCFGPGRYIN